MCPEDSQRPEPYLHILEALLGCSLEELNDPLQLAQATIRKTDRLKSVPVPSRYGKNATGRAHNLAAPAPLFSTGREQG